jgi:hypothetical protein
VVVLNRTNANVLLVEMVLRFNELPYQSSAASHDKLSAQMADSMALLVNLLVEKTFFHRPWEQKKGTLQQEIC